MVTDSALSPYALFEDAPCGLVVTQEDGKILRANSTFRTWVGFSEQELRAMRFQNLLTMGGRIFHQTHWAPLMRMQGSVAEVKLELIHRNEQSLTTLLNGVRRERDGDVVYELALFVTTERDIYERELVKARTIAERLVEEKTAAESALQLAQVELTEAYQTAKRRASLAEQMVAIVSHDLKNPLTAIKMAAGFLAQREQTDKDTRMLSHISDSANRAERMIADLLDLASARAGRGLAISLAPVELCTLINTSVDELRVVFPKATLHHIATGDGWAQLDADRVQQVIGNLVANSVAYGDLQRPITVTSSLSEHEVIVGVHNHGSVIPASLLTELFEPMARGTEVPGHVRSVGLGLFIVSEIAKAHGGEVLVRSTEQNGTAFEVHFPRGAR